MAGQPATLRAVTRRTAWLRRARAGLLPVAAALAAIGVAAPPAGATLSFQVSRQPAPIRPIGNPFLGVATEFQAVPDWSAPTPQAVDPVLVQLLRNLTPSGTPLFRIGGLSTDRTWWPIPGMRKPIGLTYGLNSRWMADARSLAAASGLVAGLGGYLDALEIGNEPELYTFVPWYRTEGGKAIPWYEPTGTPVYSRRPTYNATAFSQEFGRVLGAMPPKVQIAGPATGNPAFVDAFSPFLRNPQVRMVTWHAYGLINCIKDPRNPQYPTVANLLSTYASRTIFGGLGPLVALAHHAGAQFRVAEMGSVSCNGRRGVSDTFASALWLLDSLFTVASKGADGVNLHTFPGTDNGLFDFTHTGGRWVGYVHPLYYGALMFAQAAPAGARLLPVTSSNPGQMRVWATLARDGTVRIMLIDPNQSIPARVQLSLGSSGGPVAALERLQAPSAAATKGVTLGGHGFDGGTTTGTLPTPALTAVRPSGGVYSVTVPHSSAALLVIPPR
jgi:hypothetical protein